MYTVNDPIFEAVYEAVHRNIEAVKRVLGAIAGVEDNSDKLDFILAFATAKRFNQEAEREAEREVEDEKRVRKRFSQGKRDAAVTGWVLENVKPGMMIKVAGTRDGQGWRKVIRWSTRFDETLECQKYSRKRRPTGEIDDAGQQIFQVIWTEEPYITEHCPKKVMEVYIDGIWQRVVELIKEKKGNG